MGTRRPPRDKEVTRAQTTPDHSTARLAGAAAVAGRRPGDELRPGGEQAHQPPAGRRRWRTSASASRATRSAIRSGGTPSDDACARWIAARDAARWASATCALEAVPVDEWDFKSASVTLSGLGYSTPSPTGPSASAAVCAHAGRRRSPATSSTSRTSTSSTAPGAAAPAPSTPSATSPARSCVVDFESAMWWMSLPGHGGRPARRRRRHPHLQPRLARLLRPAGRARGASTPRPTSPRRPWSGSPWKHGDTLKEALGVGARHRHRQAQRAAQAHRRRRHAATTSSARSRARPTRTSTWSSAAITTPGSRAASTTPRPWSTSLVIAKAMKMSHYKPKRTMVFLSTTAEEYGLTNSWYDWCVGAWHFITQRHPELVRQDRRHAQHRDRRLQGRQPLDAGQPRGHADARGRRSPPATISRSRRNDTARGRHRRALVLERPVDLHRRRRPERLVLVPGQRLQRRLQDDHLPHPVRHARRSSTGRSSATSPSSSSASPRSSTAGCCRTRCDARTAHLDAALDRPRSPTARADPTVGRRHRRDRRRLASTSTSTTRQQRFAERLRTPTTPSRRTACCRPPTCRPSTPSSCGSRSSSTRSFTALDWLDNTTYPFDQVDARHLPHARRAYDALDAGRAGLRHRRGRRRLRRASCGTAPTSASRCSRRSCSSTGQSYYHVCWGAQGHLAQLPGPDARLRGDPRRRRRCGARPAVGEDRLPAGRPSSRASSTSPPCSTTPSDQIEDLLPAGARQLIRAVEPRRDGACRDARRAGRPRGPARPPRDRTAAARRARLRRWSLHARQP